MATLFSESVLKKYPDIGKFLNIVYKENIKKYSVYTHLTQYFFVKDLSEITEERLESEIKKEQERQEFLNTFFPEDWKDDDIHNAILRSIHSRI